MTGAVERYNEHRSKRKHHQREEVQAALDAGRYFALAKERVQHGDYVALVRRQGLHERTVQRWVKLAERGLKSDTVSHLGGIRRAYETISNLYRNPADWGVREDMTALEWEHHLRVVNQPGYFEYMVEFMNRAVAGEDIFDIPNKLEPVPHTEAELQEMQAVYWSFTREEFDAILKQFNEAQEEMTFKKLRGIAIERGNVYLLYQAINEAIKRGAEGSVEGSIEVRDMEYRLVQLLAGKTDSEGARIMGEPSQAVRLLRESSQPEHSND